MSESFISFLESNYFLYPYIESDTFPLSLLDKIQKNIMKKLGNIKDIGNQEDIHAIISCISFFDWLNGMILYSNEVSFIIHYNKNILTINNYIDTLSLKFIRCLLNEETLKWNLRITI